MSHAAVELQPFEVLPATKSRPDEEAVRCGDESLTWRQLEERTRRFARGLVAEGVGANGAWAILAENRFEWAEASLGNGRAGSRYVPLNWHLNATELTELLVDSESTMLLVSPSLEANGRAAAVTAGIDRVLVFGPDYEAWLAAQPDEPLPDGPLGAPLQYTGGTTGRSKGVTRSDQAGTASTMTEVYRRWGQLTGMPEDSNMLLCTPAYHALGGALLRVALVRGNRVDIVDRWDGVSILRTIEERRIAGTAMVPTQFIRLLKLDEGERQQFDVSSLRWVLHTAAPCPVWTKKAMIDWFGPVIVELYGSSEGVGPVIATSLEWLERPGTVGKATVALELSILDDDGNDLPPGEVGTIYVRRFDGVPAYYGDPEKTANMVRADGRFTVGDVGWLDDEGYLFLADRRVDLIISGGTNIYPAEIEAALSQHPDVVDVAVFGIPDPDWGQQIKAVVEPARKVDLDVESLMAFARDRLAPFKVPRSIDVVDSLPREASGKLKKHLLRAPYWAAVDTIPPESGGR